MGVLQSKLDNQVKYSNNNNKKEIIAYKNPDTTIVPNCDG